MARRKYALPANQHGFDIWGIFHLRHMSGIDVMGAIANIRDLGSHCRTGRQTLGRYWGRVNRRAAPLYPGGLPIPCSVSTVLAGLAGGLIYHWRKGAVGRHYWSGCVYGANGSLSYGFEPGYC